MYQIVFTKQADRTLRKLPRNVAQRIREKLVQIAESPYGQHNHVTKLQQRPGFRLRVGGWRIIYDIEDERLVILVLKIGPRGGVYE
ncbi:MAG: type II toxin-antitoxin system RelE/ParE family toxin [Caldilineaceae bacterium]